MREWGVDDEKVLVGFEGSLLRDGCEPDRRIHTTELLELSQDSVRRDRGNLDRDVFPG